MTSLLRGSIGERGGIRVGHRIIEINSQSTVNMKSEQLLDMLSTSTGHVSLLGDQACRDSSLCACGRLAIMFNMQISLYV